jgi:hypothetical protein
VELKVRKVVLLALGAACVSAAASAQTAQRQNVPNPIGGVPNPIRGVPNPIGGVPNPIGGKTGNGTLTRVVPNSVGGYTVYGRQGLRTRVVPNSVGGYSVYGSQGLVTRVVPNSGGGFTVYGSSYYGHPCFVPGYGWWPCPPQ